jgi:hypothetical protein
MIYLFSDWKFHPKIELILFKILFKSKTNAESFVLEMPTNHLLKFAFWWYNNIEMVSFPFDG